MNLACKLSAASLALAFTASIAFAQTEQPPRLASYPECTRNNIDACPAQVFDINNIKDHIYDDLINPLQNNLRSARISLDSSSTTGRNAIVVRGTPDDIATAQKIIADLDRPKKNYRLTYTVTEMDGTRQIGSQHYAMIMTSGQETSLKLGNKVPMATGSYSAGNAPVQTQFTYLDIGMNFDATLTEMGDNAMLKSSVDDSSVAPQPTEIEGVKEPIVRQASLRGQSLLTPHKPVMLGSVDIPGSTNHLNIEVVMEYLP